MIKIGKGLKKHKHGHLDWLVALFKKWVQLNKLFSQEMIFQSQTLPTCTGVKGTFISRWVFAFPTFVQIFQTVIILLIFSEESRRRSQPGEPGNLEI